VHQWPIAGGIRDLDPLMERIGDARVLLGEASHGTREFYTWRAEISKRLIKERGFLSLRWKAIGPIAIA
jgi:erythromycin esterase-like protein